MFQTCRTLFLGFCLFLTLSGVLRAADWPHFGGPSSDGHAPDTGLPAAWGTRVPRIRWSVALTDDGYAGPAVAGGRVFLIDHRGNQDIVRALDANTGREVWRYVYADTKTRVWGYARTTPTVVGDSVYTLSRLGLACCFAARTGKLRWSRDIIKDFHGVRPQWDLSASPLVDGDRLILCPGGKNAAVVALDRRTGRTIWAGGGSDFPGYATPVVATIGGTRQYVVFAGSSLIGVEASSGKLLWSLPWTTRLEPAVDTPNARAHFNANAATPLISGDTVFITTGYGHGCALVKITRNRARIVWESKALQSQYSTPVLHDGYVYGTSDPGYLTCLALRTGAVQWRQRGFEKGGLVAVDGKLIVMDGRTGEVVLVRITPTAYQELGRMTPLGGESRTAPIVTDGRLLVRNRKALACLDLR